MPRSTLQRCVSHHRPWTSVFSVPLSARAGILAPRPRPSAPPRFTPRQPRRPRNNPPLQRRVSQRRLPHDPTSSRRPTVWTTPFLARRCGVLFRGASAAEPASSSTSAAAACRTRSLCSRVPAVSRKPRHRIRRRSLCPSRAHPARRPKCSQLLRCNYLPWQPRHRHRRLPPSELSRLWQHTPPRSRGSGWGQRCGPAFPRRLQLA